MDARAAVAFAPGKPLEVTTVKLEGPRTGEVLVEIKATGICHTDEFTRSGADPEGLFPAILGHEGAGIVREVGPGVRGSQVLFRKGSRALVALQERGVCLHGVVAVAVEDDPVGSVRARPLAR